MSKFIRVYEKKVLLLMLFCIGILSCCIYIKRNSFQNKVITAQVQDSKIHESCELLLVNTYLLRISEASENFYDEYYTINPVVNYYSITVKEFLSDARISLVTFTSNPYLGPHESIGIDEITFSADYIGHVQLEKFDHIISYHLPENLKSLEKKRAPGKYEED
ncbi:MAG: hypothetical protein K0R15_1859 [Clostridiales bacterium]|nr:hypothetical protein [Clostridiales bacterium]